MSVSLLVAVCPAPLALDGQLSMLNLRLPVSERNHSSSADKKRTGRPLEPFTVVSVIRKWRVSLFFSFSTSPVLFTRRIPDKLYFLRVMSVQDVRAGFLWLQSLRRVQVQREAMRPQPPKNCHH